VEITLILLEYRPVESCLFIGLISVYCVYRFFGLNILSEVVNAVIFIANTQLSVKQLCLVLNVN